MNENSPRTFQTEAVRGGEWAREGVAWERGRRGEREERRRGAAVQKTVTMVVDVPVLFNDKFLQS